ncbi:MULTISPECIES: YiiX/YebB-like N1pC/P60 family cysteine hydrolase [unclassified Chryseobacterium]|uniref:YiiX/YebB-like N1pC/P60 family cysteine hydrolase n=1 Tax=unclassified Chryseobacterium TaxID=2593645 RepID=UPI0009EC65C6|nr:MULTISPECIES: YiiX/YebB-like N1pC/P60 family cysteine hydrolase [unclassified Chryseobacterium]
MRKILNVKLFAVLILIFSVISCASNLKSDLKNGDLLFVTAKNSGLSGAINNVTQKKETEKFDHIGILEIKNGQYSVLHASPENGSNRQNLKDFIKDQKKDQQNIVVYRLKPEFQKIIPNALGKADLMLGKPYNFNYILDENSYYCSDFVERAFRENQIFKLEPMTFIDPKTGKTNEFWQNFYNKKNLKVPEGELGCNPNGLAGSDKLIRIKEL